MNSKRLLWHFCAIIPTVAIASTTKTNQNIKPNVVIINADDLGFGDISCNGSKTIRTPNIDKLAKSGLRFTNLHSAAATSTPSRYALLTGEYPFRKDNTNIAAGDAGSIINPSQYTIADMFKSAGYTTAVVGKWHLGLGEKTGTQNWNGSIKPCPNDIGFDYSYILAATGDRVPCVYIENDRVVNADPADSIFVSYKQNFDNLPTGKSNPEMLKLGLTYGHDNSIINGVSRIGFMKGGKKALWVDEDMADVITNKATSYIQNHKDQPFFLYFATQDIHVPRLPNKRFVGSTTMGSRGDAIMQLDWTVGKIIQQLKNAGIYENTIVILTSDNGPILDDGYKDGAIELLGKHKPALHLSGSKYSSYEAGTRVPAILSWPAKVKRSVSDKLLCQIDFLASFASLVQAKLPANAAPDSKNYIKSFLSKKEAGRDELVLMNLQRALSIIDGYWKYIPANELPDYGKDTHTYYGNKPFDQLYNLKTDPSEKTNLAKGNPDIVAKLKLKLNNTFKK